MKIQATQIDVDRRQVVRGVLAATALGTLAGQVPALVPVEDPVPIPKKDVCVYKFTSVTPPPTCTECAAQVGYFFCLDQECDLAADCPTLGPGLVVNCKTGTGDCDVVLRLKGCMPCPSAATGGGGGGGGAFERLGKLRPVGKLVLRTAQGETVSGTVLEPVE